MDEKECKAIELTEFVRNFIPTGWKESIGTACYVHRFLWYEIEAIEKWFCEEKE